MGKIGYLIRRVKKMEKTAAMDAAKRISKRSGKLLVSVLLDMLWCGLRYGAGYTDYDVFAMERANSKQRKTYVTRGINNGFVKMLNDESFRHLFKNKDEFNKAFEDFIGRKWMIINSDSGKDFNEWIEDKSIVIAKPRAEMCGKGIEKLNVKDFISKEEMFTHLMDIGCDLLEECVIQHADMNKMYPGCVNTIRLITIARNGITHNIVAYLRIGNGGHVDNFNSGGMITRIDLETGKIIFEAVDEAGHIYKKHPLTLTNIIGFQIPLWKECLEMVKKAGQIVPEIGYVGWDIAVTPEGPVIIEGNEFPGSLHQLPTHTPDNYGLLPLFNKAIYSKV